MDINNEGLNYELYKHFFPPKKTYFLSLKLLDTILMFFGMIAIWNFIV